MAVAAKRLVTRLTPEHAASAARCVAESFSHPKANDPFTWQFNLKRHQWFRMAYPFMMRAAESKYPKAVVVLGEDEETVDAVMVNEDFRQAPPAEYRMLPTDWRPVRACFRELHTRFKANYTRPVAEGEVMHCLYFTCVRPEERGKGRMKELWKGTVEVAKEYGYRHLVAEASTQEVRDVLHSHLGFREVAAVDYADWRFEGFTPMEEVAEKDPEDWTRLSMSIRNVPSDMY